MPTTFYTLSFNVDIDFWHRTTNQKDWHPLIIHNLHVNIESDWTKTAPCSQGFIHSAKLTLTFDPKLIGFLLSSSTTCMWGLKVIGQKLYCSPYRAHKVLYIE